MALASSSISILFLLTVAPREQWLSHWHNSDKMSKSNFFPYSKTFHIKMTILIKMWFLPPKLHEQYRRLWKFPPSWSKSLTKYSDMATLTTYKHRLDANIFHMRHQSTHLTACSVLYQLSVCSCQFIYLLQKLRSAIQHRQRVTFTSRHTKLSEISLRIVSHLIHLAFCRYLANVRGELISIWLCADLIGLQFSAHILVQTT